MIPLKKVYVLDVYGRRRLGRDYDYRYGGRRREKGRPGHLFRLRLFCWIGMAVFLGLGLWLLVILSVSNKSVPPVGLVIFGICAVVAGLLFLALRRSIAMHNELYERLAEADFHKLSRARSI